MSWDLRTLSAAEAQPFKIVQAVRQLVERFLVIHPQGSDGSTDNAVVRFDGTDGVLQDSDFIVDDTGNVTSFGGQVTFPATANPSADANTLDDYEEGTWTPVLTFSTPGDLSVTYAAQQGNYTKIGHRVWAYFAIETSAFTHTTASGTCRLTGLPFTVSATNSGISTLAFAGITKANYTQFMMYAVANSTRLDGVASGSGQGLDNFTAANMPTGGSVWLEGTASYTI